MGIKLWIDDSRPAPKGYIWLQTVNQTKRFIEGCIWDECANGPIDFQNQIELISLDHDAGRYAACGGDYVEILNWLEETGRSYPIHIHSMNVVGVENMRRIIQKNNWKEIY